MTPLSVNVVPQSRHWTTSWMSAHNTGRRLAEKELSAWTRTREPGSPLLVSRSERHTQEEVCVNRYPVIYGSSLVSFSPCVPTSGHTPLCDGDEVFGGGGSRAPQVADSKGSGPLFAVHHNRSSSSSFVSFTQCSPSCGRMPLPALSLWPGRQPYRPSLVGGRRGSGPSSVAPRSRNPPNGRRRDIPVSSSLFSHGPPLCAVG